MNDEVDKGRETQVVQSAINRAIKETRRPRWCSTRSTAPSRRRAPLCRGEGEEEYGENSFITQPLFYTPSPALILFLSGRRVG